MDKTRSIRGGAVLCALLLCGCLSPDQWGCLSPRFTRLPEFPPRPPKVELRSLERHDPFPDPQLGPDTVTRPRGFEENRTPTRRALEERLFQGSYRRPSDVDSRGSAYPDAVRR